eukprot:COSAG06_NODE_39009_length_417_cov_0.974843_2_plen_22_part_01
MEYRKACVAAALLLGLGRRLGL